MEVAVSKAKRRYGDRASPTFLFPGTRKAMALSLGQHKVKPQCPEMRDRDAERQMSHASSHMQNVDVRIIHMKAERGPEGQGQEKMWEKRL